MPTATLFWISDESVWFGTEEFEFNKPLKFGVFAKVERSMFVPLYEMLERVTFGTRANPAVTVILVMFMVAVRAIPELSMIDKVPVPVTCEVEF